MNCLLNMLLCENYVCIYIFAKIYKFAKKNFLLQNCIFYFKMSNIYRKCDKLINPTENKKYRVNGWSEKLSKKTKDIERHLWFKIMQTYRQSFLCTRYEKYRLLHGRKTLLIPRVKLTILGISSGLRPSLAPRIANFTLVSKTVFYSHNAKYTIV